MGRTAPCPQLGDQITGLFRGLAPALLAAALTGTMAAPVFAQASDVMHFKGNDNTAIKGEVWGDGYHDYVVGAHHGKTMSVSLDSKAYFNIIEQGSDGTALFNGSTSGNSTSFKVPRDGHYIVRVYLMGAAADSGKKVPFTLSVGVF